MNWRKYLHLPTKFRRCCGWLWFAYIEKYPTTGLVRIFGIFASYTKPFLIVLRFELMHTYTAIYTDEAKRSENVVYNVLMFCSLKLMVMLWILSRVYLTPLKQGNERNESFPTRGTQSLEPLLFIESLCLGRLSHRLFRYEQICILLEFHVESMRLYDVRNFTCLTNHMENTWVKVAISVMYFHIFDRVPNCILLQQRYLNATWALSTSHTQANTHSNLSNSCI